MCWSERLLLIGLSVFVADRVDAQADPGPSNPGGQARPWMLAVSALRDDDAYENLFASVHLGLTDETWLSLTAGSSRAPAVEADVRADLRSVNLEHDFGPIGLSVTAERWGDENNLESRDLTGEIFFSGETWRVSLARETRDIDIFFSGLDAEPVITDLRKARVTADATGINWRYRFSPLCQSYGSWMDYDYPRAMRLVPRADRLSLLSTSSVTLAYSFIDYYATMGFERSIGAKLVSFDFGQDRSTIDGEKLRSLGASVLWPVAPRMDLEFRLGSSRADGPGSTVYGGLTLLFYGGG